MMYVTLVLLYTTALKPRVFLLQLQLYKCIIRLLKDSIDYYSSERAIRTHFQASQATSFGRTIQNILAILCATQTFEKKKKCQHHGSVLGIAYTLNY